MIKYILNKIIITMWIILCMPVCAYSLTNRPLVLTLKDAVLLSVRQNPDIRSSELDRISQKYALIVARNEFYPQYSLTGQATYNPGQEGSDKFDYDIDPSISLKTHYGTQLTISSYNAGVGNRYQPEASFKVIQPLIRGFGKDAVMANLHNAFDTEEIKKLNLKNTLISTITKVIQDYMYVVQAKYALQVDKATLTSYQQTVTRNKELIATGRLAKTDIIQVQAQVASQKVTVQNDINTIHQNRLQLLDDIGLQPTINVIIPDKVDFNSIAAAIIGKRKIANLQNYKNLALQNDITYQINSITLKILNRQLVTAKNDRLPKLDLTASTSTGGASPTNIIRHEGIESRIFNNSYVGLQLDIPIDNKQAKQAIIDAKISIDKAEIGYQEQKRQIALNTENNYNTVLSNKQQLILSKQALVLQRQNVDFAKRKYEVGRISTFELLSDQKNLMSAEQNMISSQMAYINALATFDQTLGTTLDHWGIKIRY